jgi:hypothetical protein
VSAAVPSAEAAYLLSAAAVRERCGVIFAAAERGETPHFRIAPEQLNAVAARVAAVTRRRCPDLAVPYHSRWRHFFAGGVDRAVLVAPEADRDETARSRLDLTIVSVLLDAGSGAGWSYREAETGLVLSRSEGLGVASVRAMQQGLFSADSDNPWRADAAALARVTPDQLGAAFQHRHGNELAGLAGRAALLRRLGETVAAAPGLFGRPARLGNLYDLWRGRAALPAPEILHCLLTALGPIWPGRLVLDGVPLGDCWRHSAIPGSGLVPFHKLSQWLAYSLVEPLAWAGVTVTDLDGLTGLAEYRNGGLLIDDGVIAPRDASLLARPLDPGEEAVVEWRALTVVLLDRLAPLVRERLGVDAAAFPLARILEGGTWAAGREAAAERRPGGVPPLTIASDGTLF